MRDLRALVAAGGVTAVLLLVATPAVAHLPYREGHGHGWCYRNDTATAAPSEDPVNDEVTLETRTGELCVVSDSGNEGGRPLAGGSGGAVAPTRIDSGAGGTTAATGGVAWILMGAGGGLWFLRRRRR